MPGLPLRPLRYLPWTMVGLLGFGALHAGPGDPRRAAADANWRVGQPVAIAVERGHARFDVPAADRRARTLVIVSSLATTSQAYTTQLIARASSHAGAPAVAHDPPPRPADLSAPALEPVRPPATAVPPRARSFHVLARDGDVASASNYVEIHGVLRASGQRIQVYVDASDVSRVHDDVLREVVATFDGRVFPVASRTIGQARDVDGDGRFTILLSSWLGRLAGGRFAVDGFVRGADLDPSLEAPFSNHCDMMYLNASLEAGAYLRTVMAHEYTHAVTYSVKTFTGPGGQRLGIDEDGWLDEAMAHLGEDLHGFSRANLDYRISAFLSDPSRYQLVVSDYYLADLFRSHGNRGSTYLFLRWCVDQYGPGLLPALVRSNRRGVANIEAATGASFATLYRKWSIALFYSGLDPADRRLDGFRSLRLRGSCGDWELAGPRPSFIVADGTAQTWPAKATSTRYFIVAGSDEGAVDVEVSAPPEADLQVTAVPLDPDLPNLELSARFESPASVPPRLRATIRERCGAPVTLTSLAWEPVVPAAELEVARSSRGTLAAAAIREAFDTRTLQAGTSVASGPIALGPRPALGPLVIKVLGIDANGRRVAAWAEVGNREQTPPAVAGAAGTSSGR